MAVEDDDDRAAFLDPQEHGVAATFRAATVNVIFDQAYFEIDAGREAGIQSSQPRAIGTTVDFLTAAHGEVLTINSIAYAIVGVQPDGTGLTVLRLKAP